LRIPATKRHEDIQGEILEGLVARIVTPESLTILNEVLVQYPPPPVPKCKYGCFSLSNSILGLLIQCDVGFMLKKYGAD
jgi:hypothetical protein